MGRAAAGWLWGPSSIARPSDEEAGVSGRLVLRGFGLVLEKFGAAAAGRHRSAVDSRRVRASHLAEIVVVSKV